METSRKHSRSKRIVNEPENWNLVKMYVASNKLTKQTIDSFNRFVDTGIKDIFANLPIMEFNGITYEFRNPFFDYPSTEENGIRIKIYPGQARLRNLTYSSFLFCDLIKTTKNNANREVKKIILGTIPIMVGSKICNLHGLSAEELVKHRECPNDVGGYFIVNGQEKVVLSQERPVYNSICISKHKETIKAEIYSTSYVSLFLSDEISSLSGIHIIVEISKLSQKSLLRYIRISLPCFRDNEKKKYKKIPVCVIFKAYGILSDEEITKYILLDRTNDRAMLAYIETSLHECSEIKTQEEAIEWLSDQLSSEKDKSNIKKILDSNLFPHLLKLRLSSSIDFDMDQERMFFLGFMLHKLLLFGTGVISKDDRDNFDKKRVDMAGDLLCSLFSSLFIRQMKELKKEVAERINNRNEFTLEYLLRTQIITDGLRYCLSTGNWGTNKLNIDRTGASQVLSRYNTVSAVSHLRRISVSITKDGKITDPRLLHNTCYALICPSETPEGQNIGLIKAPSMTTEVSVEVSPFPMYEIFSSFLIFKKNVLLTRFILNNDWIASLQNPKEFTEWFRLVRRNGGISNSVSIYFDEERNEVKVYCDGNRLIRPVILLQNNKLPSFEHFKSWAELVSNRVIEYLDTSESKGCVIAKTNSEISKGQFTHAELNAALMLGTCASTVPFANHNQSPRITYQSSMCKQGLGIPFLNYMYRMDTLFYVLYYLQKPLVRNLTISDMMAFDETPAGVNLIVAMISGDGYNQEDSILINKAAVERGLFQLGYYRTYVTTVTGCAKDGDEEILCHPRKRREQVHGLVDEIHYSKLGKDFIVPVRTWVEPNDVLVGKICKTKDGERDVSLVFKHKETAGYVDRVELLKNESGERMIKIKIRSFRQIEVGDKLSSTSGQKGTIGRFIPQEDMPFTSSGMTPDIILNSCCIPSRMTIGQLMESVFGKSCALNGTRGDATPFKKMKKTNTGDKVDEITDGLKELGFDENGSETMYDGVTGKELQTKIFIGCCFYQRLRHMVSDKIHCLAPDHEVLTSKGWKYIPDVTLSDEVACISFHGVLHYMRPLTIYQYLNHSGKMIRVKHPQVDLNVTNNHKMYVSNDSDNYVLRKACDTIGKELYYKKDAIWGGDFLHEIPGYETCGSINKFLVLFGEWMIRGRIEDEHVVIVNPIHSFEELRQRRRHGIDGDDTMYTFHIIGNKLMIQDPELHSFFSLIGRTIFDKRLPEWVWKLSASQCNLLLSGICNRRDEISILHVKSDLADDLMKLALHAGYFADRKNLYKGDIFEVTINKSLVNPRMDNKTREYEYDYQGDIYCLTVPTGVFYVRRNGIAVWSGNSRSKGNINALTRQSSDGRSRDGGLRLGEMEKDIIISLGGSSFLYNKFMLDADRFTVTVCDGCGLIISTPDSSPYCKGCNNRSKFSRVELSYSCKLLFQELLCMGLAVRIFAKK